MMNSSLYDSARNLFARGEIAWKPSGDTIRAFLVAGDKYIPKAGEHTHLDDISPMARKGNNGKASKSSAPKLTLLNPSAGVCDAKDVTFYSVPPGETYDYVVLFKDSGAPKTSPLIAYIYIDPVTGNGEDVMVKWDDGVNKIFKL